jgi:hypothetical protein
MDDTTKIFGLTMKYSVIEAELIDRIRRLEEKVQLLETSLNKSNSHHISRCGVCGVDFSQGVWGYVCPHSQCPSSFHLR